MKARTCYMLLLVTALALLAPRASARPLYDGFADESAFNAARWPGVFFFHFDNSSESLPLPAELSVAAAPPGLDGLWRTARGGGFVRAHLDADVLLGCAEPNATLEFAVFYANLRHVQGGGPEDDDDSGEFLARDEDYDNYGLTPQDPVFLAGWAFDAGVEPGWLELSERVDLQIYKWGGLRVAMRFTGSCAPYLDALTLRLVPTTESYASLGSSSISVIE